MKHILGISAGFHDAAVSLVRQDGRIIFAAHSERYSKLKNDAGISPDLLNDIPDVDIDSWAYYERPWMHNIQQWVSAQKRYGAWTTRGALSSIMGSQPPRCRSFPHHLSHAAAAFQTSPFASAAVVVIDAIGELDTVSIYRAWYDTQGRARYQRLWHRGYPHSIGLFYTAITERLGFRPMEDEYVTMGMAAYGNRLMQHYLSDLYVYDVPSVTFRQNLHAGIEPRALKWMTDQDIAACAQAITERMIGFVMQRARELTGESNLAYGGGVALNCVANRDLGRYFDRIWIMPSPGDAGSSLGAAALALGQRLEWRDAYLGHDIPGEYPVGAVVQQLMQQGIVGVASGPAEFGPRALGNRSFLADPRGADIKDRVNAIKQRQKFRPFAPVILEEHVDQYFRMPRGWSTSAYMQTVADVLRPDLYPAITHVDQTARVQTVAPDGSGIRRTLELWYQRTGCPMLLNTSLNVRGEPMVNDRSDAERFQQLYHVPVLT
jgi:carbamoyltransferase